MIDLCIFDMDGLLLDTERIYTEVTQMIVGRYGKTYDWALKSRMMGMRQQEASELLVRELKLPISAAEYLEERNKLHEARFPDARPLPGVERLVRHLKQKGVPICVATSSFKDAFELKTRNNQHLFSLFDLIVTGDDAELKRGKPHPDIFLLAAKRMRSDPTKCLVFEDAPSGVEAALAAKMRVCWVPDPNVDCSRYQNEVDVILDTMERFEPLRFGLPSFD